MKWGIPAGVVSAFLRDRGVVVEKTGHYSFLILFTLGITKGKSGSLLSELFEFKKYYDENASLEDIFPDLVKKYPAKYSGKGLRELCQKMHDYLREKKIKQIVKNA